MESRVLCLGIIISLAITACQKQPNAAFTTDKTIYIAGETIHLKDASMDAYSWKWTTPDGKTYTSQNLDYTIDSNDLGGTETFKLEVASKKGEKTAFATKSLTVNQYILPSDYFAIGSIVIKPLEKSCGPNSGKYWVIGADSNIYRPNFSTYLNFIEIWFPGIMPPSSGTYLLQSNDKIIPSGKAYIQISKGDPEFYNSCISISGQLNITITKNGKIRAVFNNVSAKYGADTTTHTISGDITCH